jgi:hypothetical protein
MEQGFTEQSVLMRWMVEFDGVENDKDPGA